MRWLKKCRLLGFGAGAGGLAGAGELGHAGGELAFAALFCGVVVAAGGERGWEAGHVGDAVFQVVGVLVVLAVVELAHEGGGGVAEVEGDGLGGGGFDVGEDGSVGFVDGVRFGGEGEPGDGLGEGEVAFGVTEEVHGVAGGEAEIEGLGGGEADVFYGHADDAAGDVHGVFAGGEHAAEPVEGGVGVGVADGFVERGDEIEVLLAALVVEQDAALEGLGDDVGREGGFVAAGGDGGGGFERVEGVAGVAAEL